MLDKICTDLETSKKLKELGFNDSKSEFVYWDGKPEYYHNLPKIITFENEYLCLENEDTKEIFKNKYLITCYTLEQIINELPQMEDYCLSLNIMTVSDELQKTIGYYDEKALLIGENNGIKKPADNWATTAAKLWIKLKQDKIKYFRKNGKNYFIKEIEII